MTARNTPGAVPVGAAREDGAGADAAPRRALAEGVDRVDGLGLTVDGTSILDQVGNTPLVALSRLLEPAVQAAGVRVLAKLEGNNPAGSVKDRPALAMITAAEARGEIRPGDTLIEATSGNTGIALAMVAAVKGYRMVLIMPETQSLERRQSMQAYGAELVLVSKEEGMEGARDLALAMQAEGRGRVLDQFSNDDNWRAHYRSTGPEIWRQTAGRVTHFVSAMGTTGTITGVSRFLKEQRETIRIIGAQPAEGASIAGIRAWPPGYEPAIRAQARIDRVEEVSQQAAEDMTRRLAREEGIFCGVSSGGAAVMRCGWPSSWPRNGLRQHGRPPRQTGFTLPARWNRPPWCSSSATGATAICPRGCSPADQPSCGCPHQHCQARWAACPSPAGSTPNRPGAGWPWSCGSTR